MSLISWLVIRPARMRKRWFDAEGVVRARMWALAMSFFYC